MLAARRVPTDRFADGVPGAGREPSASLMTNASRAKRLHRSQEICVTTNTVRGRVGQKGGRVGQKGGRVGQKGGRVGQKSGRVGQKSGRVAPRAWPSRGGLGPSGHFVGPTQGRLGPTGGDSRGRLGARRAYAGPTLARPSWGTGGRLAAGRGWRLGAASRPGRVPLGGASGSSPLPCAPPLPQHFLCGPFLLTANHSLSEPTTLCYALKRGERGWRGGGG